MKLILVNTVGPMGCNSVCPIIEKFGYINLPVRKRKLTEYVLGIRSVEKDKYFVNETIRLLEEGSKLRLTGGKSVFERELSKPKKLYNLDLIKNEMEVFKNKKYTKISEMYFDSMDLFNKATIYKDPINSPKGAIEQILDIHKFFDQKIYDCYKKEFKDITFVSIQRDFKGWVGALCGQNFMRQKLFFKDFKFSINNYYKLSENHENYFKNLKGFEYNFSEIFFPNTENFIKKIIKDFEEDQNVFSNLENMKFDCYGEVYKYKDQFIYRDKDLVFLSNFSYKFIDKITYFYKNFKILSSILNIFFQFFYLIDLYRFRKRNKKVIRREISKEEFYKKKGSL